MSSDDLSDEVPETAVATSGEEAPKKKRTRRGTRGGRGRKPAAAEPSAELEAAGPKPSGRKATPKIHVPSVELAVEETSEPEAGSGPEAAADVQDEAATDGQPKRKRSRRGTRGGRKRKKPAANGAAADGEVAAAESEIDGVAVAVAEPTETASVPVAVVDEGSPAEYVPMSEWIEDFDSRSRGR